MKRIILLFLIAWVENLYAQPKLYFQQNRTLTYYEAIEAYRQLDNEFEQGKLLEYGQTDIGKPLHLFVISGKKQFNPEEIRQNGQLVLFINNGIHPGEPEGIDASIKFAYEILSNKTYQKILNQVVVAIIPVYNIGGCLNRSAYWRPQQPGPEEIGFRGNARNLDLNRDFLKNDTQNAQSFAQIFHAWNPDVFLETHTTNGSDHTYVITLLTTPKNLYDASLGTFVKNKFETQLYAGMKAGNYPMIPYIDWFHNTPEQGIIEFLANGNYSSGFGSLFNTISFMTENHVYKPFNDRVLSVYDFELTLLKTTAKFAKQIQQERQKAQQAVKTQKEFALAWQPDTTRADSFEYTGYKYLPQKNPVTGLMWKQYNHDSVYTVTVPYFRYYKPTLKVKAPQMYVVPQAWPEVVNTLKRNSVEMKRLKNDTTLEVEVYYIENNKTAKRSNNGRVQNIYFDVKTDTQFIRYYAGDYLVPMNQIRNRYIVELLEPQASASLYRWNFFPSIMERREYLTYTGFEEEALQLLSKDAELKSRLDQKIKEDNQFANDHYAQMWFIFSNSVYHEKTFQRYPIARIMKNSISIQTQ